MSTDVTTQPRVKSLLATPSIKARFEEVLGKRSAAFMSSIVSAVSSNKQLLECEPMSVISSAMIAASMDLPINASLGFAYIVPYKGVAQFQIGYKGLIQLALRTGKYKTLNVTEILDGQIKKHNPFTGEMEFSVASTSDKKVGYLLYFKLTNGFEKFFYMTAEEITDHGKRYSASFKKGWGLWVDDFDAMALKTVAKLGLSKYGMLSVEMEQAIYSDQAVISDGGVQYVDAVTEPEKLPTPKTSKRLTAAVVAQEPTQPATVSAPVVENIPI